MHLGDSKDREGVFKKNAFMPRLYGTRYNLADMLDMLWVDANLREFIDEFNEVEMETSLRDLQEGQRITIFSKHGEPFLVFRREGDFYRLVANYVMSTPVNNRRICSDADAGLNDQGRGFAAGGGNSFQFPRF